MRMSGLKWSQSGEVGMKQSRVDQQKKRERNSRDEKENEEQACEQWQEGLKKPQGEGFGRGQTWSWTIEWGA